MRKVLLAAVLLHWSPLASADGLENAYFLCDIFDKTGVSSECKASKLTATVDVIIDTSEAEAGKVCSVIVDSMVQKGRVFGGRWKLRIFAPDRADEPLAACTLK